MRRQFISILLALFATWPLPALGGQKSRAHKKPKSNMADTTQISGVKLTADLNYEQLKEGETLLLTVSIKNNSKQAISYVDRSASADFKLDIRNERGIQVGLTKFGQNFFSSRAYYRVVTTRLEPGQERQYVIEVNKLYDMAAKGDYSIVASRTVQIPSRNSIVVTRSSAVKVKII